MPWHSWKNKISNALHSGCCVVSEELALFWILRQDLLLLLLSFYVSLFFDRLGAIFYYEYDRDNDDDDETKRDSSSLSIILRQCYATLRLVHFVHVNNLYQLFTFSGIVWNLARRKIRHTPSRFNQSSFTTGIFILSRQTNKFDKNKKKGMLFSVRNYIILLALSLSCLVKAFQPSSSSSISLSLLFLLGFLFFFL